MINLIVLILLIAGLTMVGVFVAISVFMALLSTVGPLGATLFIILSGVLYGLLLDRIMVSANV